MNNWNALYVCGFLALSLPFPVLYFYRTEVFGVFDLMTIDLIYIPRAHDGLEVGTVDGRDGRMNYRL